MSNDINAEQEAAELAEINQQPMGKRLGYYAKKSGPGWLQAAITLGGGSLASALFLGVILDYNLMWLQPLAMILGVVMLSAIAYVTLSSGKRPFGAVKKYVSPVLAWAWLIAAMMANIVWCLPQFALGTGAIQQNLLPGVFEGKDWAPWVIGAVFLILAALVVRAYDSDSKGIKIFETILKIMVGIVVVSFFFVVAKLTLNGVLNWGSIFKGFIPNFKFLDQPAPAIQAAIDATGPEAAKIWTAQIGAVQTDKIIAAFGTAVGINMTFLLPYSMLRKGWGKEHRGLATFDLSTGLIIPFMIATGCIVIAAASQFHGKWEDILKPDGTVLAGKEKGFNGQADKFIKVFHAKDLADLEGDALKAKIKTLRNGLSLENRKHMLVEFSQVKGRWFEWIDTAVDHSFHLDREDPLIGYFQKNEPHLVPKLLTTPGDPTTEIRAACFAAKLESFLVSGGTGNFCCIRLSIQETPTNAVDFYPPASGNVVPEGSGHWWNRADNSINEFPKTS